MEETQRLLRIEKAPARQSRSLSGIAALSLLLTVASGCGRKAFLTATQEQSQESPGYFNVPPKIDLILAENDTGSAAESFKAIHDQFPKFLKDLEGLGWNYHFATIPLTKDRVINQALASKHDPNWGSLWQPPFPGARITDAEVVGGQVMPSLFSFPENYAGFITSAEINNGLGTKEPGFKNIYQALTTRVPGTGILRDDALTAVLVISNGEDTSDVNYCTINKSSQPCHDGSLDQSFQDYLQKFQRLKATGTQSFKFYSAVSTISPGPCLGAPSSFVGERYKKMASLTGGAYIDVCTQSLPSVLSQVARALQEVKISLQTRYLVIDREPNLSTVVVKVYRNGGGTPQILEKDRDWFYDGGPKTVFTIDYPTYMNEQTGYVIRLSDAAVLRGNDKPAVEFKAAGSGDSQE